MKLEEYVDEWETDCRYFSNGDVATYLLTKHSVFVGKWSQYLANEKRRLRVMEIQLDSLKESLTEYYAGKLNDQPEELHKLGRGPNLQMFIKDKIPTKVSTDKDVINALLRLAAQQERIDFLNGIKKELEFRPNALKTSLEYRKFEGS